MLLLLHLVSQVAIQIPQHVGSQSGLRLTIGVTLSCLSTWNPKKGVYIWYIDHPRDTEPAMLMKHGSWDAPWCRTAPVAKRLASHVATLPRSRQRCLTVMEATEKDLGCQKRFWRQIDNKWATKKLSLMITGCSIGILILVYYNPHLLQSPLYSLVAKFT